ncbi:MULTISPECIES: mevalonate kinase family protein [Nitrincola]|uniref:Mevalonate kinase n=1 Tax=Nitrincola nitratireducens TaxID=1229521 RepID=W9V181_9GAMM|nr:MULTISPECIES: galactokinase family protein [Nitrincola]EXJ10716.1 mevalonate kinase [Nitrincola nitratireducens]
MSIKAPIRSEFQDFPVCVSAPGSLMLMGEHAVLHGHLALACAVDVFVYIGVRLREDDQVSIDSSLGQYQSSRDVLADDARLRFVLAAIKAWSTELPQGLDVKIRAEFSHQVGLGSSAAVTAAMMVALNRLTGTQLEIDALFKRGLDVIHSVQDGRGSGTDLAASLKGGIVAYRYTPYFLESIPGQPEIALFYAGYKMKTPDVIRLIEKKWQSQPDLLNSLYQLMNQTTEQARLAILEQDWPRLGSLMNVYQGLMDALGVNDQTLSLMIYQLRMQPGVLGCKISGSGLGDCVIALGQTQQSVGEQAFALTISNQGTEVMGG